MGLSCDCGWYDDYEWFYNIGEEWRIALTDYTCYGCCKQGKAGDMVRQFTEERLPEEDEDDDFCDDVEPVVTKYRRICEECGDLYDSLSELGFRMTADWGFIRGAHKEYKEEYLPRGKLWPKF